jgi:hypothetical protein
MLDMTGGATLSRNALCKNLNRTRFGQQGFTTVKTWPSAKT